MSVEGTIGGSRAELEPGSELAGYRIERVLGRGGMGVVYLAHERRLDRQVALKVLRSDLAGEPIFRERFRSESRTAAAIHHPSVVTVFRAGEVDGLLYVAMRYVPGRDLGRIIAADGALAPAPAAKLIEQVGAGLDAVHAAGLVHRDVKPGNVIVSDDPGEGPAAHLADFGLAKAIATTSGLTATGEVIGTVDYVAPEQIEGRRVDARTDVYALGCVLFHAVTGHVPFPQPESSAKMWAHLNEAPPGPGRRASALAPVIRRAMAKDPAERFPSAGDLGRAAVAAARHERVTEPERTVASGEAAPAETTVGGSDPLTNTAAGSDPLTETPVRTRRLPAKRRTRRRRRWILAVVVALIAALAAAAAIEVPRLRDSGGGGSPTPAGIEVPSLRGQPLDVAEQRLADLGLHASEAGGGLFGVLIPADWDVCETSPAAGTSVRPGSTVRLAIDRPDVCCAVGAQLSRRATQMPATVAGSAAARPRRAASRSPARSASANAAVSPASAVALATVAPRRRSRSARAPSVTAPRTKSRIPAIRVTSLVAGVTSEKPSARSAQSGANIIAIPKANLPTAESSEKVRTSGASAGAPFMTAAMTPREPAMMRVSGRPRSSAPSTAGVLQAPHRRRRSAARSAAGSA